MNNSFLMWLSQLLGMGPDPTDTWTTPEMADLQQLLQKMGKQPYIHNDGMVGQYGQPSLFGLAVGGEQHGHIPNFGFSGIDTQDQMPTQGRSPGHQRPFLMRM